MYQCVVIVRASKRSDSVQRAVVLRSSLADQRGAAFTSFLFSELCLQCLVLAGAVLFIFFHVSLSGLLLLPPAAALFIYVAVTLTHHGLADKHVQGMISEQKGFVAELYSPLMVNPDAVTPQIHVAQKEGDVPQDLQYLHKEIIGTVSMSEWCGAGRNARLHAFAVMKQWSGRGIGQALTTACCRAAQQSGMHSIEAVTSELQYRANNLFYRAGWESRGSYHRRIVSSALTLMLTHYGKDLPNA